MCIFMYYINPNAKDDEVYLILVNVRDEFYNRPSVSSRFWSNNEDVIGGTDNQPGKQGGSWFALNRTGKIGALLNVLQPEDEISADKKGRGFLVTDYVTGDVDCNEYLNKVCAEKDDYNGFTLVTMDISTMKSPKAAYFSNISTPSPVIINSKYSEFYAFGNSISVEHPWPKLYHAKEKFQSTVRCFRKQKSALLNRLLDLTQDRTNYEVDENMRMQGRDKSPEYLHKLSSIFVRMPELNYGSRTQTVVVIDRSGKVDYIEKNLSSRDGTWRIREKSFEMKCNAAP